MESGIALKIANRVANKILGIAGGSKLYAAPGHFYSPIANLSEVKLYVENRGSSNNTEPGIDNIKMEAFFLEISKRFPNIEKLLGSGKRYKESKTYYNNGDAYILSAIIAHLKPKQFIEIGSGFSSACAMDSADHFRLDTKFTFIEPYPDRLKSLLLHDDIRNCSIIDQPVQSVNMDLFRSLNENDILFIDSSHIMKTGSDVNFELFEILPNLKPGVVIHFHDIFSGWEYPDQWIIENNRSWNELYALRLFLMYNNKFEIVYFNDYYWRRRPDKIRETLLGNLNDPGSGIYLRRI
jgi:hypothetical protein